MKKVPPQQLSLDFEALTSAVFKVKTLNYETTLEITQPANPKKAVVLSFNNARSGRDADLQSELNRRILDTIRHIS